MVDRSLFWSSGALRAFVLGIALFLADSGTLWAQPPMENLKLWLDAGEGTIEQGGSVAVWEDQSTEGPFHDGTATFGTPTLDQVVFPVGADLPVIRFDGGSGFALENDRDMDLTEMTIYAVAAADTSLASRILIANYVNVFGFGLGISDSVAGRVKWFTAGPSNSYEPAPGGDLHDDVPVILTASHSGTEKRLYVNRQIAGDPVKIGGPSYTGGSQGLPDLTVGHAINAGGQYWMGYIAEILVYDSVDETQRNLVESYLQGKYFSALEITGNPESQNISEGDPVEFRVAFIGQAPFAFQWLRDGVEIPGATEKVYVLDHVVRGDEGTRFSVRVSSVPAGLTQTSAEAVLTVTDFDDEAIELVGARRDVLNNREVIVEFSEAALPIAAADVANYGIDGGVTVNGVTLSDSPNLVYLATSPIEPGTTFTLTVNGVQDRAENAIDADSQAEIVIFDVAATPPSDDLVLWLSAEDRFVTLDDEDQVLTWTDLARGDNNAFRNINFGSGYPALRTHDFPTGERETMFFDGSTGMGVENEAALRLTEISMYAVMPITPDSGSILSHWDAAGKWGTGWIWRALGKPEGSPTQINLFTGQLTCGGISDPVSAVGSVGGGYQILGATISNQAAVKRVYSGGSLIQEWPLGNTAWANCEDGSPYVPEMIYNNLERFAIGTFRDIGLGREHIGEIAEILVYGSVDEGQRADVEAYLNAKYFEEDVSGPVFRRGDCDQSGKVDFNDAIFHLKFLFLGENEDEVNSCKDACDSDDSGTGDFTDDINTLKVLFLGQGTIPAPGPLPDESHPCGEDPTEGDEANCLTYTPVEACP